MTPTADGINGRAIPSRIGPNPHEASAAVNLDGATGRGSEDAGLWRHNVPETPARPMPYYWVLGPPRGAHVPSGVAALSFGRETRMPRPARRIAIS
jgi:hypothetical protein